MAQGLHWDDPAPAGPQAVCGQLWPSRLGEPCHQVVGVGDAAQPPIVSRAPPPKSDLAPIPRVPRGALLKGDTGPPLGAADQRQREYEDGAHCPVHTAGAEHRVGAGLPLASTVERRVYIGAAEGCPSPALQMAQDHASPPPAVEASSGAGHSAPGIPDQLHLPWCQCKDARTLLKLLIILWN